MIKGLYFKLNLDKRPDKDIYNFFIQETKRTKKSKIELLACMMSAYCARYFAAAIYGKTVSKEGDEE